jgi:hypothetical protein
MRFAAGRRKLDVREGGIMKRALAMLVVALAVVASAAGTARATPPPLRLTVYDNVSGGTQIGFWMKHSTGWSWHSTNATAEKKLGCSITAYAWDTGFPPVEHVVAVNVKPSGTQYRVNIPVNFFVQSITTKTKATCTLRHLTAKKVWLYKTVTAHWNGT